MKNKEVHLKKKMGRPTDNPKEHRITIRLDNECKDILDNYRAKYNTTVVESIRAAIKKLEVDLEGGSKSE